MLRNASSSKVIKQWGVGATDRASWLNLVVLHDGKQCHHSSINITGASPSYVEELIERLNININNLLYELGRIPCRS